MPWKKSFDEDEVLEKAMQVFWRKGYESASINDLLEKTGINRGSLYNAFGGKQQLFVKTLIKYDIEVRQASVAQLEALDNPQKAITMLFDGTVAEAAADKEHKGCFLVNTASEIDIHDDATKAIVVNALKEFEAFFRRCIEVGQARGDFSSKLEPAATAKVLLGLVVAIRVLGRGAFPESSLQTLADQAKNLVLS